MTPISIAIAEIMCSQSYGRNGQYCSHSVRDKRIEEAVYHSLTASTAEGNIIGAPSVSLATEGSEPATS